MVTQNKVSGNGVGRGEEIHLFNKHLPSVCSGLGIILSPINTMEDKPHPESLRGLQSSEGDNYTNKTSRLL